MLGTLIPHWFGLAVVTCLGSILGSFLNCFIYRWPRRISILKRARSFCPRCGSSLTWEAAEGGFTVLIGSLDHPERVRPDSHCFVATKLPWVEIEDGTPRFPAGDTSREWRQD